MFVMELRDLSERASGRMAILLIKWGVVPEALSAGVLVDEAEAAGRRLLQLVTRQARIAINMVFLNIFCT